MSVLVQACDSANIAPDLTCSVPVWVEQVDYGMTAAEANALMPHILALFATAWMFRTIIRFLRR